MRVLWITALLALFGAILLVGWEAIATAGRVAGPDSAEPAAPRLADPVSPAPAREGAISGASFAERVSFFAAQMVPEPTQAPAPRPHVMAFGTSEPIDRLARQAFSAVRAVAPAPDPRKVVDALRRDR